MNNNLTTYYFLGIGGIGMSALARYFNAKGFPVMGYDRTRTPLTEQLEREGIDIHYTALYGRDAQPCVSTENTIVVYTPAIPQDFEEFQYFKNNGFTMLKRAQVLGEITRNSKGICIAGTHGKTTTSTMTAHLLYQSKIGCSAFLGGVSKNYDTNLLAPSTPSGGLGGAEFVVIEADEYDRSFHQLTPYMALITAADADHLDIYGTKEEFRRSFETFASLVQDGGYLIIKEGLYLDVPCRNARSCVSTHTYGMNSGDFHAENIVIENGEITFDFVTPNETVQDIQLGVPVLINVENAVGAMALASLAGVTPEELRQGMASFKGIKRRFDIQVKTENLVYIDDYAHHPEELKASILSIKTLYPNRKVCGIFQPHLYSRTRDFQKEFGASLSLLDELILLDIYAARELPIEGITSDVIFENVTIEHKMQTKKEDVLEIVHNKLQNNELDILVTFGAGDIDQLVQELKELLKS
ncbi:MAG: UDP-N-acetylmuramate--L-alanine ligase [Bacteroidales bacterium]|jgi:UDP-N-acetylmuramate--alanine ligase|nr:UDP-N-acetylmuramate--L-alanine ligase [Bacteroidales bacterium]